MAEHATCLGPQALTATGRGHWIVLPRSRQDLVLEERPHRGDSAVHRRWRRAVPGGDSHHLVPTRSAHRLPVNPVEDVGRHHLCEVDASLVQKASKVHHVERVCPHRRRRERPRLQMRQERVRRADAHPGACQPMPTIASLHRHRCRTRTHRSSPANACSPSLQPSKPANRNTSARNSSIS